MKITEYIHTDCCICHKRLDRKIDCRFKCDGHLCDICHDMMLMKLEFVETKKGWKIK